jgi:autotransporter-associated beta strand protein
MKSKIATASARANCKSSPTLSWIRRHLKTPVTGLIMASFTLWTAQVKGASYFWDPTASGNGNTGGAGLWDTTSGSWYDGSLNIAWPNLADTAIFQGAGGAVTLATAVNAGGLTFNSGGYSLSGSTLTLLSPAGVPSPILAVNNNGFGTNRVLIAAPLAGTAGFTKVGNGTLVLSGANTGLSGDIAIKGGTVVVSNPGQLGTGTTAVTVGGLGNTGNPGYSGGALVLNGATSSASATGMTFAREVSLAGRGPGASNASGALVSVGYNTISGGLTSGSATTAARSWATHGTTTISGNLHLGTALNAGDTTVLFGNGNWNITGLVSGSEIGNDRFVKTGNLVTTTMWLQNPNNKFTQSVRVDSGTLRVAVNSALGQNTGTGQVDLNNGTLEVRTDAAAGFSGRTVRLRNNTTGTIFVDRGMSGDLGIGTSMQNQTVTFGALIRDSGANVANFNYRGRNGYGVTFASALPTAADHRNWTIDNAMNGLLTYNGNTWNTTSATAGVFTVQGNGDTVIQGNILATGSAHTFVKSGIGQLTLNGTGAANLWSGTTTIGGGTLVLGDIGAIEDTSAILIGNATTGPGALTYAGATATLTKPITINTTTASAFINASGSGPLTINGTITNGVGAGGNRTIVLGGTNTGDNTLVSSIPVGVGGTTSLQKVGAGTWVLAPVSSNAFTGATTVSNGVLRIQAVNPVVDVLPNAGAIIFNVDALTQSAGGTFQFQGVSGASSSESVGALTGTSGHGTVEALPVGGGTAVLTFASLGTRAAGASINVAPTGTVNITGTSGFVNAGVFYGGADFAFSGAGTTLRVPVYGTDAGFSTSASALTAATHSEITGGFSSGAVTINSLKINGANTLTLTGNLTIGTAAGSGIIQTGGDGKIDGAAGNVVVSAAANDLQVRVNSGSSLEIARPITTSTAGLTKSGPGSLVLSGANTFSGTVNVNEGLLQMGTGGLLGATNIGLTVRQGATFDLNGVSVGTVASGTNSVNALNGAGTITNSSASQASLRFGNNNAGGYFSGLLTGNLALVKAGTGTVHFSSLNTFTGPVTIVGGALDVTRLANIGLPSGIGVGDNTSDATNAASLVLNGGDLRYVGTNGGGAVEATQTPSVSTDRLFTLAGNGGLRSFGSFGNIVATRASNNASLIFSNTADVAFSGAGVRTLTLGGDSIGDNELRIRLRDNPNAGEDLSLTKADAGLWILNPGTSNTYEGATTISGGALRALTSGSVLGIPSTSPVVLSGGVLETSGTFTRNLAAPVAGTGTVQLPSGASGFAAASAERLVVTLGGGSVVWGTTNFSPSSLVLGSSTALGETEITNDINLNGANRTVTVNNNGFTGTMVTAGILSGVISNSTGTAGFTKNGGGVLILGDANTYNGNTILNGGTVVLTSIGAAGATSSSLGTNVAGGSLVLNPGNADLNAFIYVGQGEVATRPWSLASTGLTANRTWRIDASGSGPLVLAGTLANTMAGDAAGRTLVLELRGGNTENNMITSQLINSTAATNPMILAVSKTDGGTWILNPSVANTFTGAITITAGNLGLTANGIGSASTILPNNAGIFAYGGPLTTSALLSTTNVTTVFSGSNSMTFNNVSKAAGNNQWTLSNNLENGAILTFNNGFGNLETSANTQTINLRGYGSTVIDGNLRNNGATTGVINLNIAIHQDASLTLSGAANTYTGGTTLTDGILILDKSTTPLGTGTLTLSGGTMRQGSSVSSLSLSNALVIGGSPARFDGAKSWGFNGGTTINGNRNLQNDLTGGATLTLNSVTTSSAGTLTLYGLGDTIISGGFVAGTGAGALQQSGTGTVSISGASTATGALTASRGTIKLDGANGSWGAGTIALNSGGTLTLDNATTNNNNRLFDTGAVTGNGGTLNMISNAANTTETVGALTLNNASTTINLSGVGNNTLTFASITHTNPGGAVDLTNTSSLGANNQLKFTAAPALVPASTGINTRFLLGSNFATYNGTSGVVAFSSYNVGNNLNTAAATDTLDITANANVNATRTVNAVKINGSGLTVGTSIANGRLALTAGGILNTGGNNTLNPSRVDFAAVPAYLHIDSGTTLTVGASFTGSGGFTKALAGDLTFSSGTRSYITGTHTLLGGTTTLAGTDSLFPNQATVVNLGATLDLNGVGHYVGALTSAGGLPGTGGTVLNGTLVTNGNGSFGGSISGTSTNFGKVGTNGITFSSAQPYTGVTWLMGGTTTLENEATLLNTTEIHINNATLSLSNNTSLQNHLANRIGDTTPLTLRGGTLSYTGRISTIATEAFGSLTLDQGANSITIANGGGTYTSATMTFDSLTRATGTTLNFNGTTIGQIGNNTAVHFNTPLSPVGNGAIGAWAIANSSDYAAYNLGSGVGIVGQGGFAGYEGTFASGNITEIPASAATTTALSGTTTTGMLKLAGGFTQLVTFATPTDTLHLELGGLLRSNNNNTTTIGDTTNRGIITSGVPEFVVFNNANATGATAMTIHSSIQGAGTTLVKSGSGVLALTGANTYGGGTFVSQGTLELRGTNTGDVVVPSGGLTLTNSVVTMFATAGTNPVGQGQVHSGNSVTLNGSSTFTAVGNNTLVGLSFNNNGGTSNPSVATGGVLTLTGATPISATSSNPATIPTVSGTLMLGTGSKTIDVSAIQVGGATVTNLIPSLNLSAAILSPGVALTKTGAGLLQLGGQSTFGGGLTVSAGGIVIGGNSTPAIGGNGLTSGPLGTGAVSAAAGTTFVVDGNRIIGNDITWAGTPTFDATANTAWTLTLNGALNGISSGAATINVNNPGLTVALLGTIPNIASITSFNKVGPGALIFNSTGYTGNYDAAALGNGLSLQLLHDGNSPNIGNGVAETISVGSVTFDPVGVPTITVGRAGGSLPMNLAVNKIISPSSINTVLTNGLTVANNNGYGLEVVDSGSLVGTPTFTVNTASGSNFTQGLYLNGALAGTAFVKTGSGALVLGNAGNTFTGNISVNQGVISVSSDAQLGNASNIVLLTSNVASGTATLRATDNITTSRAIRFVGTTNSRSIEVVNGKTLQLDTAFDLNAGAGAGASLIKADRGTLLLNAANSGWSGALTINGGAVLTGAAANLGTGAITINAPGAAMQLQGGITVANAITVDITAQNLVLTGLNTGGAIQSVSGTNVISSAITVNNAGSTTDNQARSFGFGADSGATLTLGAINVNVGAPAGTNRNTNSYFGGAGTVNLNGIFDNTNASAGANLFLFKYGNGILNINAANALPDAEVRIYRGTANLSGTGTLGTGVNSQLQVWQNGTLNVDNSGTNTANRFSNRIVQIGGGTINFTPNAAGSNQVSTAALQVSQGANVLNLNGGGNQTVTFSALTQNGGATVNLTGIFGTANNKITFATAPTLSPVSTGLLARITTNGNEFATYSATTGIGTFTGYAAATNILSATATQTFKATNLTANSLTGNQTLNALTISGASGTANVGGLGGLNPTTLTLTSGGILVNSTGATTILSVPVVAFGGTEAIVHVASGSSLDVTSGFSGTGGMTKALPGTLNLNAQQFVSGNTIVNTGTLNLTAGATNTLLFNNGLGINSGATVDLKNGVQFIGSLFSANAGGNTDLGGGTLTNSGAEATIVINSNSNFNGQITGTIFLNKTGTGALNLQEANTYSGATLINGGTFSMQDKGTLANTTSVTINRANLTLTNSGLYNLADRVNDAAPISLNGGSISFNGRQQADTSETLGAITMEAGLNGIFPGQAGTGINNNILTIGGLTRSSGSTATLRFSALGAMGLIGTTNRVMVTGGMSLTNNIIGPWAIIDREFATYDATYGVSGLGQNGMAGYSGVGLLTNPTATDNVRHTATGTTTLVGNVVVNTLTLNQSTSNMVVDLAGNTLRIAGGGMIIGQNTDNTSVAINNGTITSGTVGTPSDLYIHHAPFGNGSRTASIGAVIADNSVTGPVRLVISGGDFRAAVSGLTLAGNNTYTGGTVFNSTTTTLGATATLGTGGITVHAAAFIQTAGGIIPAQALTMTGGSAVTLAGNNSLTSLTINNNGGAGPSLTPTGILTLTGGLILTTDNAGGVATIGTGNLDLNGVGSYSMNIGATIVNGKDVAPWQAGLIINSIIQNGGISKSGAGLLQLSGQSTYTGGTDVTAGGLIIAGNSTPNAYSGTPGTPDPITSGPLGTGAVTMAANTTIVAGAANATVSNNFTFLGDTVFNGTNSLFLNGVTTLPTIWNATVTAPQMTVTVADASPSLATDSINKSGLGILVVGNYAGTISATGGLVFTGDGNTLGTQENLSLGGGLVITGDTAITVNRSGSAPNARNKLLQKTTLDVPGNIMSVSNLNGYGLEFTGATTLSGPAHFAVGVASGSNVVPGLVLSGVVDDGASDFGFTKSGPGTLVLGNSGNTFGGVGQTIDILNGVLSVASDGALGDINNTITLNVDGSTAVGFRSTGTFGTSRTFLLNQANNAFEVTIGNTLTLNTAFTLSAVTNVLNKNDNGVLELAADNSASGWSNATTGINILGGAVRLSHSSAAGAATNRIVINNSIGAALQLSGGVTITNPIALNNAANEILRGGINSGGHLQNVSGTNTVSGTIATVFDAVIGADAGSTLNITGIIDNTPTSRQVTFTGDGTINFSGSLNGSPFQVNKFGSGTLNFTTLQTTALATTGAGLTVHAGTVLFDQAGKLNVAAPNGLNINPFATLTVNDNSGSPTNNRLGTSAIILRGGNLNIIGSTTGNTSETLGAPTFNRGYSVITVTAQTGQQANLAFNAAANNPTPLQNVNSNAPTGASVLFRGSSLGTAAGAGIATIANSTGGFTFVGQTGATGANTKGVLPWALVDTTTSGNGVSFATTDAAAGAVGTAIIRPLAAGEYSSANTIAANNNVLLNGGVTTNVAAGVTLNSITMDASANITLGNGVLLGLSSGGLLVRSGSTSSISGGAINQTAGTTPLNIWTLGNLTISSTINGGNGQTSGNIGFVKAGAGTLTISPPTSGIAGLSGVGINTMGGQFVINGGTVVLGSGTKNAIMPNNFLSITKGTLDLNGTSQQFFGVFTDASVAGAGGIITSSAGTGNLVINENANRNFAGSIQGNVNFTRSGNSTSTFYSNNTYTGTTLITGGAVTLRDSAALSGTTSVDINYATLSLDNNAGTIDMGNRLNDSAAITLRGGTLTVQGRAQTASSETLGALSADRGFNVLNPLVGGTGVNSVDVALASLSRPAGSAATLLVQGTNLGTIGSNSRVTVGTLNGVATTPVTYSANGSGLTNHIVGGWAINGNDFLTYIPGLGLAPLNQAGAAQYDLTNTFLGAAATKNVRLTATTTIPNGGANVNAVSMTGSNIALSFATATDTLNITSGGLIGPNNNQTIGAAVDSGRITAGGVTPADPLTDLYIYNRANTLTLNSRIIDNPNGSTSRVRTVFTASGGIIALANSLASYTGGTVLNGGTLTLNHATNGVVIPAANTPADGLIINNGTVTMNNSAGQIASANIVTINGGGTLTYFGDNTQDGLVIDNIGGGTPTVNTFSTALATGAGSTGVLTIGSSGIVATSSHVGTTSTIVGRVDFGATNNTLNVSAINANGTNDISPLLPSLALQGIVGSTGGFTKTGNGVLQFNAQAHFTGPVTVAAGGIRNGVTNGGSRLSALTINSGARYDLNNINTTWGSLAGTGEVFSYVGTPTLAIGFDNTNTTFSGKFSRFNSATPNGVNISKIGSGTLTLDTAQDNTTGSTGNYTINGGAITYTAAGRPFISVPTATAPTSAVTFTVNNGGALNLNNAGTSINNRLGLNAAGTFAMQGGRFTINGNSAGATTELIATFNITNGGGRVELTPDAGQALGMTITTLNTANGSGSLVVGGIDGSAVGTAGKATLSITTPNLIGGQGTGVNGTVTMGVRHDILGDASVSGLGTGFLVRDSVTNTYRALASNELAPAIALPLTADVDSVTAGNQGAGLLNVGMTGATQALSVNSIANTITFSGTNTIESGLDATAFGAYGPGGGLLTFSLSNAAASLTLAGATANVNVAFGSTTAGTTPYVHVITGGTLNVNGAFAIGGSGGMLKADGGVMNLNNLAYFTGATTVNNGTLNLNSGLANTLVVAPTLGAPTVSNLVINGSGATVDLKGQNQTIGTLSSINALPGQSGSVTNTGALATLTSISGGTFAGTLNGALALTRAGNNTTLLTSANTYTGATIVRGGILQLRDSGSISSTAGLTLNYGTLNWDNFGLNPTANPTRIAAANPVTLQGGTITINGAGSTDTTAALNSVTVTGGNNVINTLPYINMGSTVTLTIGNLVRNATNHSGVVFNGFTANNSSGLNTLGGQGLTANSRIFLTQVNGAAFSAASLVNNLIGGWAVANGDSFATYNNTFGVVGLNYQYGGFTSTNYTGTDITSTAATGNYNDGTATRTFTTGVKASNSWRLAPGAAQTITPVNGTSWTFGVGIITNANFLSTIQAVDATNTISGTGTDLYFYVNQNVLLINPAITGTAALVSNGPATLRLAPQFASNTYSGGTFVQSGTLNLQATAPFIAIPGDLTITNANVNMNTTPNQIATTSNVTINGGGTFTLANYGTAATQTLSSFTFNNEGGTGNPSLAFGTPTALSTLILSSANPLTATNNSLATTPTISTSAATFSALQFSDANPVITVNAGLAETGLTISAPITQHGSMTSLSKAGAGALALSGANTFTTGLNLNGGSLIIGAASTPNTVGATVTSGPVGTGALNIAAGTTLLSDGTARTIANAVNVNGDFTIGGRIAGNGITLNGAIGLGAANRTITVTSPAVTATIGGIITSTGTGTVLTKAGAGTLILSNATNSLNGGTVAVTGGFLKIGVNNGVPTTSQVDISAGAGFDLNNFDQTIDGLSGGGFVTNSANASKTLTVSSTTTNSTFSGVLTDNILGAASSRLVLTKAGAGTTLTLSGANTHSGATTVTGGILSISHGSALGTTTGSTSVSSGGSLELQGGITVGNEALSIIGLGSTGTNGALRNLSGNNTYGGTVTIGAAGAYIASDAGLLTLNNATAAIAATTQPVGIGGAGNINVVTAITGTTATLTKVGTGTVTLGGANTYTGATTVTRGTLLSGANDVLPNSSGIVLQPELTGTATLDLGGFNDSIASLTFNAPASSAVGQTATVQTGAGTLTLLGNVTFDGTNGQGPAFITGNLNQGTATRTFDVGDSANVASTSAELEISAVISGNTGVGLTKAGAGMLSLTGTANTYSGTTAVNDGTLLIAAAGSLGDDSVTNTISLSSGGSLLGGATFSTGTNRTVALGTGGGNISALSGTTLTVPGVISGSSALTFGTAVSATNGIGTVVLTGANTNSGSVTVAAGTLQVGDGTSGSLTGTGLVTVNSTGTLSGSGSIAGDVTVSAGGRIAAGNGAIDTNNATLNLDGAGGLTVANSGQIRLSITAPTTTSIDFLTGYGTTYTDAAAYLTANPTAWTGAGDHDLIKINNGGLSIGTRASGTYGDGSVIVVDNGWSSSIAVGQVFNLIDWVGAITGTFGLGGGSNPANTGSFGDLDLPTLAGDFTWDTSAFMTYGVIVVVPEPSRALLLMFGLLALFWRRRRA